MCEQASRRLMDAEAEGAERSKVQALAAAELEGVRGELAAAQEALREVEQGEARLEGEVQAAVRRADEAEGRVSEVAGHLAGLQADVSCGMGTVGEKMALLEGECAALERGLRAVEAECEQVRAWAVPCGHGCSDLTLRLAATNGGQAARRLEEERAERTRLVEAQGIDCCFVGWDALEWWALSHGMSSRLSADSDAGASLETCGVAAMPAAYCVGTVAGSLSTPLAQRAVEG